MDLYKGSILECCVLIDIISPNCNQTLQFQSDEGLDHLKCDISSTTSQHPYKLEHITSMMCIMSKMKASWAFLMNAKTTDSRFELKTILLLKKILALPWYMLGAPKVTFCTVKTPHNRWRDELDLLMSSYVRYNNSPCCVRPTFSCICPLFQVPRPTIPPPSPPLTR